MHWTEAVEKSQLNRAFRQDGEKRIEVNEDGIADIYFPSRYCERLRSSEYEKYVRGFKDWKPVEK